QQHVGQRLLQSGAVPSSGHDARSQHDGGAQPVLWHAQHNRLGRLESVHCQRWSAEVL
ncbi:hypothetical protein EC957_011473, partial [Mortierella hygrophila]